jgi:flagellar motor switch protein FliN/FliY
MADDMDEWMDAMGEQQPSDTGGTDEHGATFGEENAANGTVSVSQPQFQQLHEDTEKKMTIEDANLEVILDIPVTISMEVGKTKISIRNLLKLNQGSVVELDRLAGEPLDVLVNGILIAHGEVVVVNEKYGIRLTDVISTAERIQKLK